MECRPECGACCIAPSISSPIPGLPNGKPAGVPCIQLDEQRRCKIFNDPRRPKVCADFQPMDYICGQNASDAILIITTLENDTL